MSARFIVGDSLTVMRDLPDNSVNLVMTSPPFLALRSYLPPDHPDKAAEIGSEATPGAFIDTLITIVEECDRVLAPHGSICFELGDTYSGSGGAGGDYGPDGMRGDQNKFKGSALADRKNKVLRADGNRLQQGPAWPLAKSLCMIPELFRFSLVYGFNPLTGRQTDAWRVRNVVRWVRPNPPVGALGDKFRPATSDLVIACKSARRYFDLDGVREPASANTHKRVASNGAGRHDLPSQQRDGNWNTLEANNDANPLGAPPLDWWSISPIGYAGAHYAVYPEELCVKPIKAMCPERVCVTCGEPSRRISETTQLDTGRTTNGPKNVGRKAETATDYKKRTEASVTTLGFTDCGHDNWRRGIVLDPFAGSGTTLAVALGHGRDAIGIDIDERNAELALGRLGMFVTD